MKKIAKKLLVLVIFLAMFSLFSFPSYAKDGLSLQIEPMWMGVKGLDTKVGDIFRYREEWNSATRTLNYGMSYDSIDANLNGGLTLRTELTYRKGPWGVGLSGWWFNSDGAMRGRVTTPEGSGSGYNENGVRMWDHTIVPLTNQLEASGLSPVNFWAKNQLGVWTADFFGLRTLAEKKEFSLDFLFGAKIGALKNEQGMGQNQRAYIYDGFSPGFDWDNRVSLSSNAKADSGLMGGPLLGIQGKMKIYKNFHLEALANQSLLFGKAKYSGLFRDTDDIWAVHVATNGYYPYNHYMYDGKFPFSEKEGIALPVTELKLKATYDLFKNISIGFGGFASVWWNAPVAPRWSMPSDWTSGEGTGWRLPDKTTLTFYGATASLTIQF